VQIDKGDVLMNHYSGFVMKGNNMSPTVNEGDHIVVDLAQKAIRSGEIYIIAYKQSNVVCRLLLDGDVVRLVFDGTKIFFEEPLSAITIIGRVIEVKAFEG